MRKLDRRSPLVGIPVCVKDVEGLPFHAVGEKYASAVVLGAEALPLLIPAFGPQYDMDDLVDRLDGLLVTGSASNVAVHLYDGPPDRPESPQDPMRDATALPLIQTALERGLPIFCICRGLQELNVALGGTLHTEVHEIAGRIDHRAPQNVAYDEKYAARHEVEFEEGGEFQRLLGKTRTRVNSLHWQALDRLAPRLVVEGRAPDGTIEAVRVEGARAFALGVQWHPEYRVTENPDSLALFRAFGAAAKARAARQKSKERAA